MIVDIDIYILGGIFCLEKLKGILKMDERKLTANTTTRQG